MSAPTVPPAIRASLLALALPLLAGGSYVWISCERFASKPGECALQWTQAAGVISTGVGWVQGFWQPNQVLRKREQELLLTPPPVAAGPAPEPPASPSFSFSTQPYSPPPLSLTPVPPASDDVSWSFPEPTPPPAADTYSTDELEAMTVVELRELGRRLELRPLHSNARKGELVEWIAGQPKLVD